MPLSFTLLDLSTGLRFLAALGVVLGLLALLAFVLRRMAMGLPFSGGLGRVRRLTIVEAIALDHRRRLVLIRRDETEHLLLLGLDGEQVIERDIGASPPGAGEQVQVQARAAPGTSRLPASQPRGSTLERTPP